MRFSYTAATLALMTGQAYGHARVFNVWVNGKEPVENGNTVYIRSPDNNSPVKDLSSPNIVCNTNGGKALTKFAPAAAGDKIEFEWYHDARNDDIIDGSHKGPLITYIAPYTEGDGTGAIWTKIHEESYSGGEWAVDKIKKNKGKSSPVTIPASLKAGKYLIRHEIIAHHESDTTYDVDPVRGAQFYPSCIQFEITGTGSDVPPQNFDFNTGYKYSDKGIHYNLYNEDPTSYKAPGPEVWTGGAGSGSGSSPAPTTTAAPAASSSAAAVSSAAPTTLATQVSSAAPVATTSAAAAPSAAPSNPPSTGCKRRRSRKARRSAH